MTWHTALLALAWTGLLIAGAVVSRGIDMLLAGAARRAELEAAGRAAEAFSARPGTVFVPARGGPPTSLCVAWRADDLRPAVLGFVKVATGAAGDSA